MILWVSNIGEIKNNEVAMKMSVNSTLVDISRHEAERSMPVQVETIIKYSGGLNQLMRKIIGWYWYRSETLIEFGDSLFSSKYI